jgi:hypothetical protein
VTEEAGGAPLIGADLEYDLAHDAAGESDTVGRRSPDVLVATVTPGYDGDYSYDLAHDVPKN